ncbi:uncharacterized protein LAJ45_10690 [Morchella importuna]|uniref:uncharacterized protein n=1 Tax=Morchella importuna TaxID=1174673 RepID=UPI001E8DEDF4|nr:uncharacterized protein LAJ45_10690 [Morchella importuna]KAH8145253.1 hypothetical protein LAJ45_10690 [Morchella importuna]
MATLHYEAKLSPPPSLPSMDYKTQPHGTVACHPSLPTTLHSAVQWAGWQGGLAGLPILPNQLYSKKWVSPSPPSSPSSSCAAS